MRFLAQHLTVNLQRFSIEKAQNTIKYSYAFSQSKRCNFWLPAGYNLAA